MTGFPMKTAARHFAVLATMLLPLAAAEVAGVCDVTYATSDGHARKATLNLKVEGDKVSGTVSSQQGSAPITEGKLTGKDISFTLVRRGNGDEIHVHYTGTVEGETMTLKMQYGNREPIDMTARRSP